MMPSTERTHYTLPMAAELEKGLQGAGHYILGSKEHPEAK